MGIKCEYINYEPQQDTNISPKNSSLNIVPLPSIMLTQTQLDHVRFEVVITVKMSVLVFYVIMECGLVEDTSIFGDMLPPSLGLKFTGVFMLAHMPPR
jgi:hypothetical protein